LKAVVPKFFTHRLIIKSFADRLLQVGIKDFRREFLNSSSTNQVSRVQFEEVVVGYRTRELLLTMIRRELRASAH
jgi:hypothetical protein